MKAVIIDEDYKGSYSRYALTQQEFREIVQHDCPDAPNPAEEGDSYTVRPLVHLWYQLVEIGNKKWDEFFTDMEWGLPESDIENGNPAYISYGRCHVLRDTVARTVKRAERMFTGEWIPAKERLPETSGFYLCVTKHRTVFIYPFTECLESVDDFAFEGLKRAGFYYDDQENGELSEVEVIYWMPLPKAPKEGDLFNENHKKHDVN